MSLIPYPFCVYIDKLEECLEDVRSDGTTLTGMVITILLYANDISILASSHDDINKKLRILQYMYSNMGMIVNIDKTKVMIIKYKKYRL